MEFGSGAVLALALTAGVLAAFNPCGFALLPAYLTLLVTGTAEEGFTRASALRRGSSHPDEPTVVTADFTVDLAAGRVSAGGTDVRLTPTEWRLLEVLARNHGRVVEHHRLLLDVWGPAYQDQTNYLRVFMATLRRKLEPDPAHPRHLLTEPGRGYRFEI